MIKHVLILAPGETPDHYTRNPGSVDAGGDPDGWGETAAAAITELREEAGIEVVEHWHRGETLWIVPR